MLCLQDIFLLFVKDILDASSDGVLVQSDVQRVVDDDDEGFLLQVSLQSCQRNKKIA